MRCWAVIVKLHLTLVSKELNQTIVSRLLSALWVTITITAFARRQHIVVAHRKLSV